ncbi:class III extradiol ring-cleavage dioxygenase [Methylophilus sp. DW102]|uniref:DODA-type extradiol aromatic ring-opening family dioxygenase n=1 Tax=Methylophilus sp. DW102 TaxID=3095607 RepID=UPI0030852E8F|nr:dioxygenase [Methylophilus sp. DW102]
MQKMPVYFLSHGGGPWLWLMDEMGDSYGLLHRSLQDIPAHLPKKPKAMLVVSGHWEEEDFTVMAHPNPPMIYDYSGFPEKTYHIHYKAPGAPTFAHRIMGLLASAGIGASENTMRGYDHGVYTIAYPMYPDADVPIIQLSIQRDYSPEAHMAVGRVLAPLREEGILIIVSGMNYHDLCFPRDAKEKSRLFDRWITQTLTGQTGQKRSKLLTAWESAPAARFAHPREDHFIPLMIATGAAEDDTATVIYNELLMGMVFTSSYRFDAK